MINLRPWPIMNCIYSSRITVTGTTAVPIRAQITSQGLAATTCETESAGTRTCCTPQSDGALQPLGLCSLTFRRSFQTSAGLAKGLFWISYSKSGLPFPGISRNWTQAGVYLSDPPGPDVSGEKRVSCCRGRGLFQRHLLCMNPQLLRQSSAAWMQSM